MYDTIIKDGLLATEKGCLKVDIAIQDGKIAKIGKWIGCRGERKISAHRKIVFPGVIDVHTHIDTSFMGCRTTDDFKTGTISAAAGGTTTVIDFLIQKKGERLQEALKERFLAVEKKSVIDYGFHIGITDLSVVVDKDLKYILRRGISSFKFFTAYKKASLMIDDVNLFSMLSKLKKYNAVGCIHAEDGILADYFSDYFISRKKYSAKYFPFSKPYFLEEVSVFKIVRLAEIINTKVYFVHLSTKGGVEILKNAKKNRIPVYGETCPHYLILTADAYKKRNCMNFVVCPPLRNYEDCESLWNAVANGAIDTIATDHISFSSVQKKKHSFDEIPPGLPSIQLLLSLMYSEGVAKNRITLTRLVQLLSYNPAVIFRLYPKKGSLKKGSDADIVIFSPKEDWKVDAKKLAMNVDWSPYENMRIIGKPWMTLLRGEIVYENDTFIGKIGSGAYVKRV